jgi:hypothetical protein
MPHLLLCSFIVWGILTGQVHAQDPDSVNPSGLTLFGEEVEITLTLPGWLPPNWSPALDGTVTVRDRDSDVDTSIGDALEALPRLLDALDFGLLGEAEFRVGDWLFRGGFATIDQSGDRELLGGRIQLEGKLELDYVVGEVGYRLGTLSLDELAPALPPLEVTTDLFAGLRYHRLAGGIAFESGRSLGDSTDWVDAALGLRLHVASPQGGPLGLTLESHIAGFGSNFTWDAKALLDYQLGSHLIVSAGWKTIYVDYDDDSLAGGDFGLNLWLNGPAFELGFRF